MSEEHANNLRLLRDALVQSRRHEASEALRLLPIDPIAALTMVQNVILTQGQIETLDRAVKDEQDEGYLPKGA